MRKWIAMLLAMMMTFSCAFAEDLVFTGEVEEAGMTDEEIIEFMYGRYEASSLPNLVLPEGKKDVTVLTHYDLGPAKELYKELFGGEVIQIICGVQEYASKLQNLIGAGTVPDLVVSESTTDPCFVTLANAGLVQPIDAYIDYNEPELLDLKSVYEAGLWNGQHYLAPYDNKPVYYMIYNSKIFEEYGYETPWELWEKGEWTWDAFRELAAELNITDENGDYICYGTGAPGYGSLTGSTGVDYVALKDGFFENNLTHPDVVRAENYLNDMLFKDDIIKIKAQGGWRNYWNRGMVAMQIIDSWMLKGSAEVSQAIQEGTLGIVPLPQDPQKVQPGVNVTYAQSGGFCLVQGAQNPEAAAAFIRTIAYSHRYPEVGETYEDMLAEWHEDGWSNDLLYQYQVARDVENMVTSFGYGFMSTHRVWVFLAIQNNWTTFVESIRPLAEESLRELMGETTPAE